MAKVKCPGCRIEFDPEDPNPPALSGATGDDGEEEEEGEEGEEQAPAPEPEAKRRNRYFRGE